MKKILVIAPYAYLPYFSGGQKLIAQFLDHLGNEVQLTVITVKENDFSTVKTYTPLPILKKSFFRYLDWGLVSKISYLIKKEGFDAVIWEHPYFSWLAFRVRKRTGVKTIIHTHNIESERFRSTGRWWWRLLKKYERSAFRKADAIFFITPADHLFATKEWNIDANKCFDLPFGVEIKQYPQDKIAAGELVRVKYQIESATKIIFFNGLLDYKPNLDALKVILDEVNPMLLTNPSLKYKIIISGKRLPAEMDKLKSYVDKNVIYTGFVDDISTYFKAADVFLNPVQSGGGIKTKMVEAIAYGTTVIATQTGATGIDPSVAGEKLIVVADSDWKSFTEAIIKHLQITSITPLAYYDRYYWGKIAKDAVKFITEVPRLQ